jgi:outer membrane protein, heavy metal efflux system
MNVLKLAYKPTNHYLLFGILLLIVLSINVSIARAENPLTLDEAVQLATQSQPLLQSFDDAAASSHQAAIAEGQLPDPKIKFGVTNLPVTNSNAFHIDREDMSMVNIGISQEMVSANKRKIASDLIEAEGDQFHTEQLSTARSIKLEVALAWLNVYEAQRKSELYQREINEMQEERKIFAAMVSSGGTQSSDVINLDSTLSLTQEKRIFTERDERKARASLARWIGDAAARPIATSLPNTSSALNLAESKNEIENHPLLKNAYQTEKVAQLDAKSAQANLDRNWGWEVGYGKRFADRSDMLSFQVSIDLQLDRANRQDRRTAEKLVLIEKAQKLTEDRRRQLSAELDSAIADAQAAKAREKEYVTKLIPYANAKLSLAQAGYQAGKQPLNEVWEARRNVIEVELNHWSILTDQQRAEIKIGYLLNDHQLFQEN